VFDIAKGLDYLHSMQPTIVHGDLKAVSIKISSLIHEFSTLQVNILITDERRACLADFGLATTSESQVLNLSSFSAVRLGGTLRWTAPELLDSTQNNNSTKSDIFAFACVCYEVRLAPDVQSET
jgi:serine/threonine protein kinase